MEVNGARQCGHRQSINKKDISPEEGKVEKEVKDAQEDAH
jgi:hypothetical protein